MLLNICSENGVVVNLENDVHEWIIEYMKWERDDLSECDYSLDKYCDLLLKKYIEQLSWESIKLIIKEVVKTYWEEEEEEEEEKETNN